MTDQRAPRDETVDEVLRMVAEGRLSAEEADVVLSTLETRGRALADHEPHHEVRRNDRERRRHARIEVVEGGRSVVNLRIPIVPLSLGRYALSHVPGLSDINAQRITDAIERGLTGPILEVNDEDGDSVRIVVE